MITWRKFFGKKRPNLDGIKLLASILVCYPEIGTVSFEPREGALKFSFALKEIPVRQRYEAVGCLLEESILAYHSLEGFTESRIEIFIEGQGHTAFFHIVRDVSSLSQGEIHMITEIMRDKMGDILYIERDDDVDVETIDVEEGNIDRMIGSVKWGRLTNRMVGVREAGRVMVFNK